MVAILLTRGTDQEHRTRYFAQSLRVRVYLCDLGAVQPVSERFGHNAVAQIVGVNEIEVVSRDQNGR